MQRLVRQRARGVNTIFRLANTSLLQVYRTKREFTWSLYNEPEITGQGYVMCKKYRKNNNNEIKAEIQEKAGWITFHLFC